MSQILFKHAVIDLLFISWSNWGRKILLFQLSKFYAYSRTPKELIKQV